MKKIFTLLFCIIIVMTFSKTVPAKQKNTISSEKVNTVIYEQVFNGLNAYKVSKKTNYFSIKEISKIYNARLEWKPLSSIVTMHLNNRKIDIQANSTIVVFGRKKKRMSLPSRLINGNIYIPPEIITSNEFEQFTETKATWDPSFLSLTITHKPNISSIRFFTKEESSKIIIYMDRFLPYTVKRTSQTITLNILNGKILKNSIKINNGIFEKIQYHTNGKATIVKIMLQESIKSFKTEKLVNPHRILVDVVHLHPIKIIDKNIIKDTSDDLQDIRQVETISPDIYGQAQLLNDIINTDTSDLNAIPVTKFTQDAIFDDSFNIVDDTSTLPITYLAKKKEHKKIIVIDAGHGGKDSGTVGTRGIKEKDINLKIAQELKSIFRKNKKYETILTRNDDTFIPLAERTNIANKHNADLFVSIHCNAIADRSKKGFEIYFLSEKATNSQADTTARLENSVLKLEDTTSKKQSLLKDMLWSMTVNEYINSSSELGALIASNVSSRVKILNKGVKQANFYVLRGAQMPAVLIECAFLSNTEEENKLNTKKFRTEIATSIYEGIVKYYANTAK